MPTTFINYTIEFLIKKIKENNLESVRAWLTQNQKEKKYDLTQCYGRGFAEEPVLFTAVKQKNLEIFGIIAEESGQNLSKLRKPSGDTLLHVTIINEWTQGLDYLVENHINFIPEPNFFNSGSPIFVHLINQIQSSHKRENALVMMDLLLHLDNIEALLSREASKIAFQKIDDQLLKKKIAKKINDYFSIQPYSDYVDDDKELTNYSYHSTNTLFANQQARVMEKATFTESTSPKNDMSCWSRKFSISDFFLTESKKRKPYISDEEITLNQPLIPGSEKK